MEEWRDIEGYEGLYQVSSLGRIKSLDRYDSRGNHIVKVDVNLLVSILSLVKN